MLGVDKVEVGEIGTVNVVDGIKILDNGIVDGIAEDEDAEVTGPDAVLTGDEADTIDVTTVVTPD